MNSRKKIGIVFVSSILLAIILTFVIIYLNAQEPPTMFLHKAGKMIYKAKSLKSSLYSAEQYSQAVAYYDSAMLAWQNENTKWLPWRNFNRAYDFAMRSYSYAEKAVKLSQQKIADAEELLDFRISLIEDMQMELYDHYRKVPVDHERSAQLSKIDNLISEGKFAYEHGNYLSSKQKLDLAESMIQELKEHYEKMIHAYFEMFPQWSKWVDFVIHESKRNRTVCIVVDKFARECILYRNGKLIHRFDVELGANWIGDKNQQGDKSTPEGLYKIERKKSSGQTKYYKALLLDYPNEEDKIRFFNNKKNRVISQDALIGGLIEIHGSGGRGIDWTDGCIALQDSDMDILYEASKVGVHVAIVGSTRSYEGLFLKSDADE